jgi:hypothetical protein
MDELAKLSINNLVAAVPKHARAAAVCEVKPHCDWVTQLVYVDGQGLFRYYYLRGTGTTAALLLLQLQQRRLSRVDRSSERRQEMVGQSAQEGR